MPHPYTTYGGLLKQPDKQELTKPWDEQESVMLPPLGDGDGFVEMVGVVSGWKVPVWVGSCLRCSPKFGQVAKV